MLMISGKHRTIGLIGNPVEHTLSPLIHSAFADSLGLAFVYLPFNVEIQNLGAALSGMKALGFAGTNVTIPYKSEVLKYIDRVDPCAAALNAVNTVSISESGFSGYNTDGEGFIKSLKSEGVDIGGKTAVIIGAGGAARAVASALLCEGAKSVIIAARNWEKAKELCSVLRGGASAGALDDIASGDIIVNATPLGMNPNPGGTPVKDINALKAGAVVVDLVYNPRQTRLMREAEERGIKTVSGIGMLIYQAALSFEKFTGRLPDDKTINSLLGVLSLKKNIALTGFMGTGKTTIGKAAAEQLGTGFIDTDRMIEEAEGMSVSEIFKTRGEGYFREAEKKAVLNAARRRGCVIALGGGVPLNREIMDEVAKTSCVIRIKATADEVLKNLSGKTDRPLLLEKTREDIIRLMGEREPFYKNCDAEITASGLSVTDTAGRLITKYFEICTN